MERTLWIVTVLTLVVAWFATGGWRRRTEVAGNWVMDLVPLVPGTVAFLVCVPVAEPFASGLGLGWGFLLGSIAAVASFRSLRADKPVLAAALLPLPAVLGAAFLFLRDALPQALTGIAGGWAGGLLLASWAGAGLVGLGPVAVAGVAVATAAQVGVFKGGSGGPVPKDLWPLVPVLAAGSGVLVRAFLSRGSGLLSGWPGGLVSAGTALAVLIGARLRAESSWDLVAVTVAGLLLWALLGMLVRPGAPRWIYGLAGLLLVTAEVVVADRAANYGVGLWALGVALGAVLFPARGGAGSLPAAAVLLAVLRTFVVPRVGGLTDTGLAEQVALAALLVGALLPSAIDGLASMGRNGVTGRLAAAALLTTVPVATVTVSAGGDAVFA
ncbi:MAG: hypothetical protein ACOVT5_10050, partial [Armatimonadaceae bacterium]